MRTDLGFSLLELLIALALGSVLSLAMYQLFFYYQQQAVHQQAILTTHANTRLALHMLHHHLQNAGEAGCDKSAGLIFHHQMSNPPEILNILGSRALQGYHGHDGRWTPPLPALLENKVADNTDVVLAAQGSQARAHLAQAMRDPMDPIYINQKSLFAAGDIVLIADCTHADLIRLSAVQNTASGQVLMHLPPENHSAALSRLYAQDAQIMRWQIDAYYLASSRDAATLALYKQPLLPASYPIELVAGLQTWAVEYALLQQGIPLFVNAAVANAQPVLGLRLHVLGVTQSKLAACHPYYWLDTFVMPQKPGFYWPAQLSIALYNQEA